jgi:hypothetical protein
MTSFDGPAGGRSATRGRHHRRFRELTHSTADLLRVAHEWAMGHWLRVLLVFVAFLLTLSASMRNGGGQASTAHLHAEAGAERSGGS